MSLANKEKKNTLWGALAILIALVALIVYVGVNNPTPPTTPRNLFSNSEEDTKIAQFKSDRAFREYVQNSQQISNNLSSLTVSRAMEDSVSLEAPAAMMGQGESADTAETVTRYSETNVQVAGIDEPDIVKTDGESIYYSSNTFYEIMPVFERTSMFPVEPEVDFLPPTRQLPSTRVIDAFPPEALSELPQIDMNGDLLLDDNTLVVISGNELHAYDVSIPSDAKESWSLEFDTTNSIVTSRMLNGTLYVISKRWLGSNPPCPMPLTTNGIEIACTSIYHPVRPVNVDTTYTISEITVATGALENTTSFVGGEGSSVVYMSSDNIFLTYSYQESQADLLFDFFVNNAADLVSNDVADRIEQLSQYDISEQSKLTEMFLSLENYYNSLDEDEQLKIESELENRSKSYMDEHKRDIAKTGIVRVSVSDLSIEDTGSVPGTVLNQFSLDEYQGNLRVATTTSNNSFLFGGTESVNDVYVLDQKLQIVGSILDLGISERIYSARFVGDSGYLVTFRQIDPFYVLDLTDPENPQMTGELKIPGFSSYLHPLTQRLVLGIGREDGRVKASLFDVSDKSNPLEKSTFYLSESWSEIQNTHHAFLHDSKHGVFFVPGTNGGYIFSYANDEIVLETAVSNVNAERALFINDYLYVIGSEKIVVLDETSWERVNELEF